MKNSFLRPVYALIDWIKSLRDKSEFEFPSEIGDHGTWCMNRARDIIGRKHKLPKTVKGKLELVKPERMVNGRPSYRWGGFWIGGLCSYSERGDFLVKACWAVGGTLAHLIEVVLHEFGHVWLWTKRIFGHPAEFDKDFAFWKESRIATGVSFEHENEEDFTGIYEVDSDGVRWITHIDITGIVEGDTA